MPRYRNYKHRKRSWGHALKRIALFFLFLLAAGGVLGGLFLWGTIKNLPDPSRISDRKVFESTKIYDRTGTVLLYEIHGEEKRTVVRSSQIGQNLKDATIVAEDFSFYEHRGIDYRSIIRAFLVDLYHWSFFQGGSTITQQLVKNTFLGAEKTLTRKIKEAALAIKIEKQYAKEEILTLYLNQIPYGSNAYGAEAAAQTFFDKNASGLTLNEAAALAALPKAPSYYSPYGQNKDELLARKDAVLERMRQVGFISSEEFENAKGKLPQFAKQKEGIRAPHFVMYVKNYLEKKFELDYVENGGLRVRTTLDYKLQEIAEETIAKHGETNEKKYNASNAALAAVDPKTGQLLAMVGSRDYFNIEKDGNFNVTTSKNRQPGSAFKPFAYAEFFQKGFTPDTMLFDVETEFSANPEESYKPGNYDDKFRGPVSAKSALAQSLNVPSVKVLYLAGLNDTITLAENMGITTLSDKSRFGLSLVLGGGEVRPIDMAYAYSAFANDGARNKESFILEIKNGAGDILEKWSPKQKQVLPPNIARTISAILSDNALRAPIFGESSPLFFENYRVAAKTGTTQKYRDAWVAGYTPTLSTVVWVGNNDGTPMERGGAGIAAAGPIFHDFMEKSLASRPMGNFPLAEPILSDLPMRNGNYFGGVKLMVDKDSGKLATASTPPNKIEEKSFKEIHEILHYINKDDPQYQNWEAALKQWLDNNKGFILGSGEEKAPTEYDDIHTEENKPKISASYYRDLATPNKIFIIASANGRFFLKEVVFYLNGELAWSDSAFPYETTLTLPDQVDSEAAISIRAYDRYDNVGETSFAVR